MAQLKTYILSLLMLSVSVGCGQSEILNRRTPLSEADLVLSPSVPVETFLISPYSIPNRLKASELELKFVSNIQDVDYECRSGKDKDDDFESCDDTFAWDKLIHGKSYSLNYRAKDKTTDRRDATPVKVKFTSDQQKGQLPVYASAQGDHVKPVKTVKDLPHPTIDQSSQENRNLLLGPNSFLIVPYNSYVYYYGSSSSIVGETNAFTLITDDAGSSAEECERRDNSIESDGDLKYCESFPAKERLRQDFSNPFADDMIVLTDRPSFDRSLETILAGYFTDENNYKEDTLLFETQCAGSMKSEADVPYNPRSHFFSDDMVTKWSWCLTEQNGSWLWKTFYSITIQGPEGLNARLRIVHQVRNAKSMPPGSFLQKSLGLLSSIIMPSSIPLSQQ
jgi:hypothetical protein